MNTRNTYSDQESRSTCGIAHVEDLLAETRGMAEELVELAQTNSADLQEHRKQILVIANSIESRLDGAEFQLTRELPRYQRQPSISTREHSILDEFTGQVFGSQLETVAPQKLNEPEIEF